MSKKTHKEITDLIHKRAKQIAKAARGGLAIKKDEDPNEIPMWENWCEQAKHELEFQFMDNVVGYASDVAFGLRVDEEHYEALGDALTELRVLREWRTG